MIRDKKLYQSLAALFIAWALIVTPVLNVFGRAGSLPSKNRQRQTAPAADGGFPRAYKLASGSAVMYAPQIVSWEEQKHAVAWAALSYESTGGKQAHIGTIKIEADTSVALDDRLVDFSRVQITEINFPQLSRGDAQKLSTELQQAMSANERVISLDRVLAAIDSSKLIAHSNDSAGLKADPPKIFYSSTPAILVSFDGEPIWSPVKDVDLKFAVNTNWDIFEHTPTKTYYLRNDKSWLKASDLKGSWSPAGNLPASFSRLPAEENWQDVKANLPGKALAGSSVPSVFVSDEAAELIALQGGPKYTPVPGTSLFWVSNTESDLFRNGKNGLFYYLVAGRWFSAADLNGPWTFATPDLPADFQRIPVEHPRSRVLASVPGTAQAAEAVLLASVPQTARVNKKQIQAPDVAYQGGKPEFKPIESTTLERAVNTDKDIIKYGDIYYMCFQGVWFRSRSAAGPWEVADNIPQQIYRIPPSSPSYHVTYVTEVKDDDDDDDWITFAAVAGYTGLMIAWGCAVWGSGWYYRPYVWYGGFYPAYYWHPRTYGFSAWYNPYTGTYGRGASVYGPYGGAGAFAAYNPRTGTYARGGAVYGAYNSRGFAQAWNPRTGTYAQTRQGGNVYGNWGSSYVRRGDDWARTGRVTNYRTGTTTRGIRTDDGGAVTRSGPGGRTTIGKGENGDVFAGHDGNVYRKDNGQWQKWDNGGWNKVQKPDDNLRPTRNPANSANPRTDTGTKVGGRGSTRIDPSTYNQLERDKANRSEGNRRTQDSGTYRRDRGGRDSAGSFRGGGLRGGGGGLRRGRH